MSLDPAMAALAARTAEAWRAEQELPGLTDQQLDDAVMAGLVTPGDAIVIVERHRGWEKAIDRAVEDIKKQDQRLDALPLVTAHTASILIPALQALRPELAHFAGAAHRDPIALAVVQEWQLDREASEDVLRERGRARRGGGR